jgi:hypothetical protein
MSLYDTFRELPLHVEEVVTDVHVYQVAPEFTRKTTVVHLRPEPYFRHIGPEGLGEDVTYDPNEHEPHRWPWLDLLGDWTLESFSARLDEVDLFPAGEPQQTAYRDYRRWAYESAALDLALKQAQLSTGEALGRQYRDVTFVSSTRATSLDGWLALYPDLRFKLDPTPEWTDDVLATLAGRGNVDVVDLKGQYRGTVVDNPADPELYRRVAEAFPDAWIEDPDLDSPDAAAALEPYRARITWDAPIHSWADVEALPFEPKCLNVKPSRFGTLARLFEFYERCEAEGIALYGGGQFELSIGRGQIQILAALFSADGPNDVAPGGYNANEPLAGLETSPLKPLPERYGFRRGVPG